MKALKIIGLVILALWMAVMTLQMLHLGKLVQETCTYARAASSRHGVYVLDGCR
jgi:hypothetical protein